MNQALLEKIEAEQYRKDKTDFAVGDSVRVHTKVVEGDKERIQVFAGVVIGKRGRGLNETFTVRRISYGEGVERVFPLHSPRVDKIEVERKGEVRRAKLTYLRKRLGKGATLVREKEEKAPATDGLEHGPADPGVSGPPRTPSSGPGGRREIGFAVSQGVGRPRLAGRLPGTACLVRSGTQANGTYNVVRSVIVNQPTERSSP